MRGKAWDNLTIYDDVVRNAKPESGYLAAMRNRQDPAEFAVKAPERGGSNIGGFKVDNIIEEAMRSLLDRGIYGYRTKADICRAAVTHFVMDQLMPSMDKDSGVRFEAYRRVLMTEREENIAAHHATMLRAAEGQYTIGSRYASRSGLMRSALFNLKQFLNTYDPDVDGIYESCKELFTSSPILGKEFEAYLAEPEDPLTKRIREAEEADFEAQAEHMREMERLGKDEALDALAREQEG